MTNRIIIAAVMFAVAYSGCSRPTAEEEFKRAETAEAEAARSMDTARSEGTVRALFTPVIEGFRCVIDHHPRHVLSELALFRIANIRNNYLHDAQAAVDTYNQYITQYPDGEHTPLSMFLVGYLYNNELHNIDSAGVAYRRFLQKYPNHEMAVSAQFELNTLGKRPEELIPASPPPPKTGAKKSKQSPT
ncbi:MAG: tetratricopeptide repeat protein [Bacteroidota bacterium]